MATKNTAGKAAGQAAALPETLAVDAVRTLAGDLQQRSMDQFAPLCKALSLLTNMHRVLTNMQDRAALMPSLCDPLRTACSTWGDPLAAGDALDVISDFARVVAEQAVALAHDIEGLDRRIGELDRRDAMKVGV